MSRIPTRRKGASIRARIIAVVLVGIATTTVLVTVGSAWREAQRYADAKRAEIEGTAAVLASAVADAVAGNDRYGVLKALRAIGRIPSLEYARVADSSGRIVAELGGATTLGESRDLPILLRKSLSVTTPVLREGREIGTVTVLVNTSELRSRLIDSFRVALIAALLSAGLGVVVAFRLQDRITKPLRKLTSTMAEIQKTSDFSSLVEHDATDETGILVDAFNGMMGEIQQRDSKLSKHREILEQTVEERTLDLRIAKDAAEHANAAKSEFLATMSHEIRTPMNGMLVMAELLASARLDERYRRYADVVLKSGQSLLTILNDILDFSKIESGKLELESIELDPATIVDDVLNLFWERAFSKGIDLAAYVASEVPEAIIGDPVRLNQVVSNLVNNALKFTESGHVMVLVDAATMGSRNDQRLLRFRVSDTGIGIPQDKLASVFESFSQADQTTTRNYGGTGLGLAICKRLVEAMNGTIGVSSTVGKGSEFQFTITVLTAESQIAGEDRAPRPRLQRAIVSVAGAATSKAIVDYLGDRGFSATLIDPCEISDKSVTGADVVFADVQSAAKLSRRSVDGGEGAPYIVCLSQIGDNRSDELIAVGHVHERLMRPVSRFAMNQMLNRLEQNAPLGRAILEQHVASRLPSYQGTRALVADDSPINREVVFEALKQLGVQADLVFNGAAAIDAAVTTTYDLIFMDCSMPEMDGFEATRHIRKRESEMNRRPVPIVALTAHIAGGRADEWRQAGMDDYITKPFRVTDLARCFDRFLVKKTVETSATPDSGGIAETDEKSSQNSIFWSCHDQNARELPVIDHDILDSVAACGSDGQELFVRVLSLFRQHAPKALLSLAEAARDYDHRAIADASHALKSMCRNIGAQKLGEACHRLEANANAGDLSGLASKLAELPLLLTEVLEHIRQMQPGKRTKTGTC